MYVDSGSPLFSEVVNNVPVVEPKSQAFVSKQVRATSLASMRGTPQGERAGEKATAKRVSKERADKGLHQPVERRKPKRHAWEPISSSGDYLGRILAQRSLSSLMITPSH